MIKATINTKGVERMMRTATKQVRYAAALALSEAAEDYQRVATVLMRQTIDRPIPFTQRGLKYTRASASGAVLACSGATPVCTGLTA